MQAIREINKRYWQQCTGFHALILVYTGYWPLAENETNSFLKFARIIPFLALGGMTTAILTALYDLMFKLHDYILLAEALTYIITLSKALLVSIIGIFRMDDVVRILNVLETFTIHVLDAEEKKLFEKYRRRTKLFTLVNILVWCGYSLIFTMKPLMEAERRFPLHYNLPLESPLFEIFYIFAVVAALGSVLLISACDFTIISGFIYLCGYLEILQYKLEHSREISVKLIEAMAPRQAPGLHDILAIGNPIDAIPNHDMAVDLSYLPDDSTTEVNEGQERCYTTETQLNHASSVVSWVLNPESRIIDVEAPDEVLSENDVAEETENTNDDSNTGIVVNTRDLEFVMRRHLGVCWQMHQDLIRVVDESLHRTDYILFLHLVTGAVILCLTMFLTTNVPFGSSDMFLWSVYLCLVLEELYGYCWASSKLNEESVQVSDALYFSDWTEASPSYKRSMLIMMSRAVRPLEISTMNFLTFDMEMFTNVVNSAYSYYNVMSDMHKKD